MAKFKDESAAKVISEVKAEAKRLWSVNISDATALALATDRELLKRQRGRTGGTSTTPAGYEYVGEPVPVAAVAAEPPEVVAEEEVAEVVETDNGGASGNDWGGAFE